MADFDHGATDSGPDPIADFSSCSHPFGPCPVVLETVRNVDPTHYPDPAFHGLRKHLGEFHAVDPDRIVPGAEDDWRRRGRCPRLVAVVRRVSPRFTRASQVSGSEA